MTVERFKARRVGQSLLVDFPASTGGATGPSGALYSAKYILPATTQVIWTPTVSSGTTVSMAGFGAGGCVVGVLEVPRGFSFDRVILHGTAGGSSTMNIRTDIYASDGTNGQPGTVVYDFGTTASNFTGLSTMTTSGSLSAGIYWIAIVCQGTGSFPTLTAGVVSAGHNWSASGGTPTSGSGYSLLSASVTGAFSNNPTWDSTGSTNPGVMPRLGLRLS